jgi:hypothetical protein
MSPPNTVSVELWPCEALVLFELLSRTGQRVPPGLIEHPAEQRVLDDILCALEEKVAEPFAPDYRERLERAREEVLRPENGA